MSCRPIAGIGSGICRQQRQVHDGLVPRLQAQGPQLPPVAGRGRAEAHGDLIAELMDIFAEPTSLVQCEQALRQLIQTTVISWTMLSHTLSLVQHDLSDDIARDLGRSLQDVHSVLEHLQDPLTWPFLAQSDQAVLQPEDQVAHYELWCQRLCEQPEPPWRCTAIARPVGRERIILHAFSGRRRKGDFQWYLEYLHSQDHSGVLLFVVSLDVVIDSKYGDLADQDTRNFWLSHILQGYVHGFLGGPPCSTFSKARGVHLSGTSSSRHQPRPVRSGVLLWGLDSLSLRELSAVIDGNVLLTFCLEALFALSIMDRAGLLEHPREPDSVDAPSIWKLPIMQLLARMPNVAKLDLAQRLYGATSSKPTTLLAVNSPSLLSILRGWQIAQDNPRHSNIGTDCSGNFKTTHLKEYPPALCAGLAEVSWQSTCTAPISPSVQLPESFLVICKRLHITAFSDFLGPDFVQT